MKFFISPQFLSSTFHTHLLLILWTSLVFLCPTRSTVHVLFFLRRISVTFAGLLEQGNQIFSLRCLFYLFINFVCHPRFIKKLGRGKGSSSGTALLTGRAATRKMMRANYQLSVGHIPRWKNLGGCVSGSKGLKGCDVLQCLTTLHTLKCRILCQCQHKGWIICRPYYLFYLIFQF